MNVIRCNHCGTTNRAGSNFCNRCGVDLRSSETDAPTNLIAQPGEDSPPMRSEEQLPAASTNIDDSGAAPIMTANVKPSAHETAAWETLAPISAFEDDEDNVDNIENAESNGTFSVGDEGGETQAGAGAGRSHQRLVTNIQGLLAPLGVANERAEDNEVETPHLITPPLELRAEQLRRLRLLMTEDPVLLEMPTAWILPAPPTLRIVWILILVGLAVTLPIFLWVNSPVGAAQQWPGVAEAYRAVEALPTNSLVYLFWAYDPATAGEMDLVALPLASHLAQKQIRPVVVSLLPGGPASARRLFAQAVEGLLEDMHFQSLSGWSPLLEAGFLPGGAAVLPLVAQEPTLALAGLTPEAKEELAERLTQQPQLAIMVAAQFEDVQQWLEVVQPLNQTPVVAFTSAGADPLLRPYLDSGQLRGLVTGFDGAASYQQLRTQPLSRRQSALMREQLIAQNWGHITLLVIILLGNLAFLNNPQRRRRHG